MNYSFKNILPKNILISLVSGIILGIFLYLIPLQLVKTIPHAPILQPTDYPAKYLSRDAVLPLILLTLSSLIASLILLILNKRLVLTIAGWTFLIFVFGYQILNRPSSSLTLSYQLFRNLAYLYFFLYLIGHFIIHGIAWLYKRKRKIITIYGVINYWLLFVLTIFSYALVTLI